MDTRPVSWRLAVVLDDTFGPSSGCGTLLCETPQKFMKYHHTRVTREIQLLSGAEPIVGEVLCVTLWLKSPTRSHIFKPLIIQQLPKFGPL